MVYMITPLLTPKQLCALAHLESTHAAVTFYYLCTNTIWFILKKYIIFEKMGGCGSAKDTGKKFILILKYDWSKICHFYSQRLLLDLNYFVNGWKMLFLQLCSTSNHFCLIREKPISFFKSSPLTACPELFIQQ